MCVDDLGKNDLDYENDLANETETMDHVSVDQVTRTNKKTNAKKHKRSKKKKSKQLQELKNSCEDLTTVSHSSLKFKDNVESANAKNGPNHASGENNQQTDYSGRNFTFLSKINCSKTPVKDKLNRNSWIKTY